MVALRDMRSNIRLKFSAAMVDRLEVQEAIRKLYGDFTIQVENVEEQKGAEHGDHFMSVAMSVTARGKRTGVQEPAEWRLFLKRPFSNAEACQLLSTEQLFKNEAAAYGVVVKALQVARSAPLPLSRCLIALPRTILLEDLRFQGFAMLRGHASLPRTHLLAVLRALADLHAASFVLRAKNPDEWTAAVDSINEVILTKDSSIANFLPQSCSSALHHLRALKPEEHPRAAELADRLQLEMPSLFNKVLHTVSQQQDTDVLNHGDCWMNNMMFHESGDTVEVRLVDLQVMRLASPAADLSYLLYINMLPQERQEQQDQLLEHYLKQLHGELRAHGLRSLAQRLDLVWLRQEMRRMEWFGFAFGLMLMPVLHMSDKQKLPDMNQLTKRDLQQDASQQELPQLDPSYTSRLLHYLTLHFSAHPPSLQTRNTL